MSRYVAITFLLVMVSCYAGPSPLRLTIDCSLEERDARGIPSVRSKTSKLNPNINIDSFCNLIHNAIPNTIKDGKFVLMQPDMDQTSFSDTQVPMSVSPPKGFIPSYPRLKVPKLKIPKLKVPKLRAQVNGPRKAPNVGVQRIFGIPRVDKEETSAERMEKFKKGVQKMLHFVKVLGQIDQYLSERTRIIVDKLTKTFAEK